MINASIQSVCMGNFLTMLYTIGAAALVFTGWQVYSSYKNTKNKTDNKPAPNEQQHPVSSE